MNNKLDLTHALHNELAGDPTALKMLNPLKQYIETGILSKNTIVTNGNGNNNNNNNVSFVSKETWKLGNLETRTGWTADELLEADFPKPPMIVPGLVVVGLNVLAGRPKAGKSYLALQLAGAIGTGGRFLGDDVSSFPVLYLALEDNAARLKRRILEQQWPKGADVHFELQWPLLNEGGLEKLDKEIADMGYKLIIIDTLSRAVQFNQDKIEQATLAMSGLQRIAFNHDSAILAIDHHKKHTFGNAQDVIDDVLGSTGKTAVADNIIGLYRAQGEKRAELKAVGRDQDFTDLTIDFAHDICTWQLVGETRDVLDNERYESILEAITELEQDATHSRIQKSTDILPGTLTKDLRKMAEQGVIDKIGEGRGAYYKQREGAILF